MSLSAFFLSSVALGLVGLLVGLMALALSLLRDVYARGRVDILSGGMLVKVVFNLTTTGGLLMGIAVLGLVIAALWWGAAMVSAQLTPGKLALASGIFGVAPLVVAAVGSGAAHLLGGTVGANGARGCFFLGIDVGSIVYTLFMSYWLVLFTGGLAMMGLMGSGVWALVRLLS